MLDRLEDKVPGVRLQAARVLQRLARPDEVSQVSTCVQPAYGAILSSIMVLVPSEEPERCGLGISGSR